ncbi:baculoviral IAP repeat containing deterin [Oratosquilla oratoria]|uniref:baculoviral IAP repeat containing deterin n=1 Tax=Oratosquilla oratoria TaxID=337810 RepID=UPI003F7730FB
MTYKTDKTFCLKEILDILEQEAIAAEEESFDPVGDTYLLDDIGDNGAREVNGWRPETQAERNRGKLETHAGTSQSWEGPAVTYPEWEAPKECAIWEEQGENSRDWEASEGPSRVWRDPEESFMSNGLHTAHDDHEQDNSQMAEAGFHFIGNKREPDLVCCYVCFKELDGWEEGDNPWEEHKSHASYCPFIKLAKEDELSVQDSFELEMHRNKNLLLNKLVNKKVAEFETRAKETRELLLAMATS